jgi:hypothetical protein
MGRSALIAVLAAGLWGCPSTGRTPVVPQPDGGPICQSGDNTCAAGTRCVNRNCVPSCAAGCPAGTYCEGPAPRDFCVPVTAIACANSRNCPAPQVCFLGPPACSNFCTRGVCASQQLRADGGYQGCLVNAGADDACGPDAVCYTLGATTGTVNACVGLPACNQDGGCPGGTFGSVCNDALPDGGQILPGKQRICLFSYCLRDSDCNQSGHCFHTTSAEPGRCNFGLAGDPCFTKADCFNAQSCAGADGGVLDGGVPGACQ